MRCKCGFENAADARFCGSCRSPLGQVSEKVVPQASGQPTTASVPIPTGKAGARPLSRTGMVIVAAVVVIAAAGYWWMNRPPGRYKVDNGGLYPINVNDKYGYMDRSGKTVITPQFEFAGRFSEGLAMVRVGTKAGYINTKGTVVITPQFEPVFNSSSEFRFGRARVVLGHLYGFIDKDGKYIRSPDFISAGPFSGDLAPIMTAAGEVGFVDRAGKVVMSGKFERVLGFSEGLAGALSGGKWGFIDVSGKWIINPQFDGAGNFADGLAPVIVAGRTGYIDREGKFIVNPQYDSGDEFYEGYASVNTGGAISFIDTKGQVVGEQKFQSAGHFSDGLAPVKTAGGWGFIDRTGNIVIKPQFVRADNFQNGLAPVMVAGKEASVDKTGAFVGEAPSLPRQAGPDSPPVGTPPEALSTPPPIGQSAAQQAQLATVPDDIGRFIQAWRNSFVAGDFDAHMECYAPLVEKYYQKRNLTRANVRREREGMIAQYGPVRIFDVSNVEVTSSVPGRAEIKFRTHWELSGRAYFAGEDTEKLTLIQTGGKWLITSEEELTVYWVKKQPQTASAKPEIGHPCKDPSSHQPCSESAPSVASANTVAKDNAPSVSAVPPAGDPVKTVLDAFDAYVAGNTAGVTSLMSDEGARNMKTYCQGDAASCLRNNYGHFGSMESRSAVVISHDAASAKVRLISNWQKAGSSAANAPQCQTYDLSLGGAGWRINSFSWPVPKTCY